MTRVEIVAFVGASALLLAVVELVRQRKLAEGYSLLWLATATSLLMLALWRELLEVLAGLLGIFFPPMALFVISIGAILLILLQFSMVITRLDRENKLLAQELAMFRIRNAAGKPGLSAVPEDVPSEPQTE